MAHGFVNEQAGGPFRTHWQRHHLVENHMDAFNYQCTGDGNLPTDDKVGWIEGYEGLNHSALYFAVQIPQNIDTLPDDQKQGDWRPPLPPGDTPSQRKERQELLDTDGALPMWLAETIVRVLVEVYANPGEGGLSGKDYPEYDRERGPHPLNLLGKTFQDWLGIGAAAGEGAGLLAKWLGVFGTEDPGESVSDLLEAVAPGPAGRPERAGGLPAPVGGPSGLSFHVQLVQARVRNHLRHGQAPAAYPVHPAAVGL